MQWSIVPGQALRLRRWDHEYVLYNDLSGDTHLLGAGSGALLEALRLAPADTAALARLLGEAAGLPADDDLLAEVGALLDQLQKLSLIEGRPC